VVRCGALGTASTDVNLVHANPEVCGDELRQGAVGRGGFAVEGQDPDDHVGRGPLIPRGV
jgi:hypothetical protein